MERDELGTQLCEVIQSRWCRMLCWVLGGWFWLASLSSLLDAGMPKSPHQHDETQP